MSECPYKTVSYNQWNGFEEEKCSLMGGWMCIPGVLHECPKKPPEDTCPYTNTDEEGEE